MINSFLELSPASIVDSSNHDLRVLNIETGRTLHFTKETESFFLFFEKPRRLSQYFDAVGVTEGEEQEKVLKIVTLLMEEEVLVCPRNPVVEEVDAISPLDYVEPIFLKEGKKSYYQMPESFSSLGL